MDREEEHYWPYLGLVVEDHEVNRLLLVESLEELNIATDQANTLETAKQLLEKNIYDILFVDIYLQNTSGIDLVKAIRQMDRPQPLIIITTVERSEEVKKQCFDAGVNEYLEKPITKKRIIEVLKKYDVTLSPS